MQKPSVSLTTYLFNTIPELRVFTVTKIALQLQPMTSVPSLENYHTVVTYKTEMIEIMCGSTDEHGELLTKLATKNTLSVGMDDELTVN